MDEGRRAVGEFDRRMKGWMQSVPILCAGGGGIPSVAAAASCRPVCLTLYRSEPREEKQARGSRRRESNCCVEFGRKHYGDVIREGGASVTYLYFICTYFGSDMSFH